MKKKDVYIAMCTQLKVSSPGGVRSEDTQVVLHQSNGRGHDTDQSQHVVQTRVQSDAHQVTQQTCKRGKRRDLEGLRGRGRVSESLFWISRSTTLGLEDTARRMIHLAAMMIGSIHVELISPIEICK